jgi:uncharacterized protein (DUF983 family)
MESSRSRSPSLARALVLRCPRCGDGKLFAGWFRMHPACDGCGLSFAREPGFYLGSIYINYGITVLLTGALYATILGGGGSHEVALAACLAVAVLFPLAFFRHARSLLLALDSSVNRHQGPGDVDPAALAADDASAGCLMGAALAAILVFGLGMAVVTVIFSRPGGSDADPIVHDEVDLR